MLTWPQTQTLVSKYIRMFGNKFGDQGVHAFFNVKHCVAQIESREMTIPITELHSEQEIFNAVCSAYMEAMNV